MTNELFVKDQLLAGINAAGDPTQQQGHANLTLQIVYKNKVRRDCAQLIDTPIITKHTKPSAQNTKGGIVKKEAPIHISNIQLFDAKTGGATKVRRERQDGKLVRIAKKSGEAIK